jgi:heptosyltransferase I
LSHSFANSAPEDICLVRLSAIGDTCHALAVVRRLQDNWPDARITWIIGRTEAGLMGDIADVEFITFDKSEGLRAYRSVHRKLTGRQFDVALCMHASMRANLLCRLIPSAHRLGFDRSRAKDFQWLFTNDRIPATGGEHALEAMMGFATCIGARPTELRWEIPISADDRAFARTHCGEQTVIISPCSSQRSRNFRNWPVDRYVDVVRHLRDRFGVTVLLTGGGSDVEHDYGQTIEAATGVTNLVGSTNLKQLYALISAADALVCPDSGPAHMATTAGTPVVGLYATSNPARTGPYLCRARTVNRYPEAARKFLGKDVSALRWGQRIRHPGAMALITVEDVLARLDDIFNI